HQRGLAATARPKKINPTENVFSCSVSSIRVFQKRILSGSPSRSRSADIPWFRRTEPHSEALQYSDRPTQPLVRMRYTDTMAAAGKTHSYRVIAVNTVGEVHSQHGCRHGKCPYRAQGLPRACYSEPKSTFQMLDVFAPVEGTNHPVVI